MCFEKSAWVGLNKINKPILCYGSVTWTITQTSQQMLNAFERKILRRIYGLTYERGCWRPRWNIWYMIDMIWCDTIYDMIDMIYGVMYDTMWYDMVYDMIYYMIWYNMIYYMIWLIWYDMIRYDIWYDVIWLIWYDIFISCNWVSTQWQWSVNVHKTRKGTAMYKRRNNTQNDTKTIQRRKNTQN